MFNPKSVRLALVGAATALTLTAFASADPTPIDMTAIVFPISVSSLATAVATAGGTMLVAYFGIKIGFGLVKKLMRRVSGSV